MSYSNKTHQKPFKVNVEKYCDYLYLYSNKLLSILYFSSISPNSISWIVASDLLPFSPSTIILHSFTWSTRIFLKNTCWRKIMCGSSRFSWINLKTYLTCKTHWAWEEQFSVAVWCIMTYDTGVAKGVVGPAGGCATHCTLVTMRSLVLSLASLSTSWSNNNALKRARLIRTNYLNHIQ